MPSVRASQIPPLVLRRREMGSGDGDEVVVRFSELHLTEGDCALTVEILWQDVHKTFREKADDVIRLMEHVLHTVSTVLTYGLRGHLGRDYELLTADGEAWKPLRHLQLP